MPAPISVVIPTLNAASTLPACAASLMEGLAEGLVRELIVCDAASSDATQPIARALGAIVVEGPQDREGRIAKGVEQARGDWLLILPQDGELDPGWSTSVRRHIEAAPGRPARFRPHASGPLSAGRAAWQALRAGLSGKPVYEPGLLLPRSGFGSGGAAGGDGASLARLPQGRPVVLAATIRTGGRAD